MRDIIKDGNSIPTNRFIVHAVGYKKAYILNALISKSIYYTDNGMSEDGWFFCTVDDLYKSTGMKYDSQTTAIKKLQAIGAIEYAVRGLPAKRYFRVVADKIHELINKGKDILRSLGEKIADTVNEVKEIITDKRDTPERDDSEDIKKLREDMHNKLSVRQVKELVAYTKSLIGFESEKALYWYITECYHSAEKHKTVQSMPAYMKAVIKNSVNDKEIQRRLMNYEGNLRCGYDDLERIAIENSLAAARMRGEHYGDTK